MRAFLIVMDSVGIGGAPDADQFFNGSVPDTGSNTVGHIAQACARGQAETDRSGPLHIPTLLSLGLAQAVEAASGLVWPGPVPPLTGRWAAATEQSKGKDTPSGHWELAGLPVPWDWHYFPDTDPAFPPEVMARIGELTGGAGSLCNRHASGTAVIDAFGAEHLRTGQPICYTSVDSVLQIAAHEEVFGLERLYALCRDLTPLLHGMKVGRVIARPFVGQPGAFRRTQNRKDFAVVPPATVLTDWVQAAGGPVHAIGKIGDIFSMQGIDDVVKGDDATLMRHLQARIADAAEGSLTFANFVEFDSNFGHRRDVAGYASALEWFDRELAACVAALRAGDLLIVTADHGNDPTWTGTDHTRERVPVLVAGAGVGGVGHIAFADVAATIAAQLGAVAQGPGRSFLHG